MSGEMVQILVVLATIAVHFGSALHVEVSPHVVNPHVTDVVTIYCYPNDSPDWTQSVIIVELGKTGQSPMVILQKSGLRLGKNMETRMTAEGHINEVNITESFIKLSIKEPSASDGGQYVCKLFFMDAEGSLKEGKAFGNVTVDNNNNEVVHTHLLKRLSEMEKQLRELKDHTKEKDAKVETELEHQANHTEIVRRQLEKDIDTLNTQNVKQNEEMDTLKKQHEKDIDTLNTRNVKQNEEMDTLKKQHKKDIDTLNTRNVKQNEEIDALKKEHEKDINTLKTQLEKDIDTLNTRNVKQNEEIDALNKEHEKDINTLKTQHEKDINTLKTQHEKDIDTLKTQLKTFETQATNHITKANRQSGFMAGLKYGDNLLYDKTNKFRDVQLNIGNHFDAETSLYTAPWDGLYTFYLTVRIPNGKYCQLDIRVNGTVVSGLWAHDADYYVQSSVSAFVSLKAGDTVDVYGSDIPGTTTLYASPYPYTYFSGFLVKAT